MVWRQAGLPKSCRRPSCAKVVRSARSRDLAHGIGHAARASAKYPAKPCLWLMALVVLQTAPLCNPRLSRVYALSVHPRASAAMAHGHGHALAAVAVLTPPALPRCNLRRIKLTELVVPLMARMCPRCLSMACAAMALPARSAARGHGHGHALAAMAVASVLALRQKWFNPKHPARWSMGCVDLPTE